MFVKYKMQTPFGFFTTNIKQPKQIVIENEPHFNRRTKESEILMGNIQDLDPDGIRQRMLVLDGIC